MPERHYDLVGGLLAAAVAESIDTGAPVQEVLHRTAYDAGKTIGAAAGDLLAALEDAGYEPRQQDHDAGAVVLGNCPFHRLAQQFTALVCGVNLHLLRGVADGTGDSSCHARARPGPGPLLCTAAAGHTVTWQLSRRRRRGARGRHHGQAERMALVCRRRGGVRPTRQRLPGEHRDEAEQRSPSAR